MKKLVKETLNEKAGKSKKEEYMSDYRRDPAYSKEDATEDDDDTFEQQGEIYQQIWEHLTEIIKLAKGVGFEQYVLQDLFDQALVEIYE
jgi:hypothetical protein